MLSISFFRDSRPEIRALCIAEMGTWMKDYRYLIQHQRLMLFILNICDLFMHETGTVKNSLGESHCAFQITFQDFHEELL